MKITIVEKANLEFETSKTSMDRENEVYKLVEPDAKIKSIADDTIKSVSRFIDSKFLPFEVVINLEYSVKVLGPNYSETVPASLVLSQQIPKLNQIRMGMADIEGDEGSFRSILAHEMGHMIMEWVARKSGATNSEDDVIQFWSKPIYEGVADFAAACVTNTTLVGSDRGWFKRDILKYQTLEESQSPEASLDQIVELAFRQLGYLPDLNFYSNWLATAKEFLHQAGIKDPYSEGTWVAGRLWKMTDNCSEKNIWNILSEMAFSGAEFTDSNSFVDEVNKRLQ